MKEIRESCPLITRRDANKGEDAGERGEIKRKEKDRGWAEVLEDAANHADGRELGEFAKTGMDNHRARWGRRIATGAGWGHPAYTGESLRPKVRVGRGPGLSDRGLFLGKRLVFGLGEQGQDQNAE